jgi:hypothetical protein
MSNIKEKQKESENTSSNKNKLFLGDEIKINAHVPESKLQNNVYEIVYVDYALLKLKNKQTQQVTGVKILNDKIQKIEDEEVSEIQIIKRKSSHKYVDQRGFKIDMTISIELVSSSSSSSEDEEPLFIMCKVVDVDAVQDVIEVKLLLDDLGKEVKDVSQEFQESIFIHFGCSGLPPWIKEIKVIDFRPKPVDVPSGRGDEEGEGFGEYELGEEESGIELDLAEALDEGNKIFASIMYEVPLSQRVVSETKQYDDLLESIISSIPKSKRTDAEMNRIHRGIERFFQLRKEYSLFDKNGVPRMSKALSETDKPCVEHIQNLDTKLLWVLPVVENIKKLYVTGDDVIGSSVENGVYDFKEQILEEKNVYPEKNAPYNPRLMEDLNSYLTPFENPKQNPDNKYVTENKPVHESILTISTNNDTVASASAARRAATSMTSMTTSMIQTHIDRAYNPGLTKLEFEDVKSNSVKRVDMTPDDPAFITSFVTLNKEAVVLTQAGLPDTLLSDRVLIDSLYLKTWSALISEVKYRSNIATEVINVGGAGAGAAKNDDEETRARLKEYKGGTVFSDVIAFAPNETISKSTSKISNFIHSFVPTNEDAFAALEFRLNRCLSVYEVVYALQPFLIYNKDLTERQYNMMREFINKNISDYMKRVSALSSKFKKFVDKNAITKQDSLELFYDAFINDEGGRRSASSKDLHKKIVLANDETTSLDEIFKLYNLNKDKGGAGAAVGGDGFLSSSEIMKIILDADFARLYMDVMAVENSDLTSSEMDTILKREQEGLKEQMQKELSGADSKTCKKREIRLSRVYSSLGALEIDNGKPGDVMFDSKYDSTGKRVVKDGDYAALKIVDADDGSVRYDYYVRKGNEWVVDKDPELQNVQVDDPSYFCNIPSEENQKPLCFSINEKCLDKTVFDSSLLSDLTNKIIDEFDSKSEMKKKNLDETFLRDLKNIKLLSKLKVYEILKYNQKKYILGQEYSKKVKTIVKSPYQDVVDCIIGIDDVAKKYQCILDFVNSELFVRDAFSDEDVHWYYCKSCGVPGVRLLPTFLYKLAQSYNPQDPKSLKYITLLSQIERTNGKREGDQIVDKYSGYMISKIALVSEEGWAVEYDEGGGGGGVTGELSESAVHLIRSEEENASDLSAVNSGEIIDASIKSAERGEEKSDDDEDVEEEGDEGGEDVEDVEEEGGEGSEGREDENKIFNAIINHYETSLSVLFKSKDKRFIKETVQLLIPKKKTKEQYELDKKMTVDYEAYEKTYNQYLIFYSMALIIVVIQTSIPQIKSKITFPNCVKSFSGYPLMDETDLSFVVYMTCITQKIKSDYAPWNSVKKINQEKMRDTLFNLIKTKIVNQPQIQMRFDKKREYDAVREQRRSSLSSMSSAGVKINVASLHFRPLLVDPIVFITSTPLPVTKTYCDDLKRNLKNGSSLQTEKILVLQSKVIHFSLIIQKLIQEVISSQTKDRSKLLSKNYIQNACCNDGDRKGNMNTLDYMISHVPNIKNYCDMVDCTSAILDDIYSLSDASTIVDPRDTRNNIPELPTNFDESTIYNAFMTYCNYGKNKGASAASLSEEIHKVCKFKNTLGENREIYNILKSSKDVSHSDKIKIIDKIKNEYNLEYTTKDLQHLLQIVNGQTMKPMDQYESAGVGTYNEKLNRILTKAMDDLKTKSKSKESKSKQKGKEMIFSDEFIVALKNFNENRTQVLMRELQLVVEKNIKILTDKCEKYLNITMSKKSVSSARSAIFRTLEDVDKGIFKNGGIMLFNTMENTLLNGENNSLEVSVEFVKNAIKNITQVYPNIILSQIPEMESLPPYISGQLSTGDSESIITFSNERITKNLDKFYTIGSKKSISTILKNVQMSTLFLNEVVKNTNVYTDAKHITVLLYEYYFLQSIDTYIFFSEVAKQKQGQGQAQGKSVVDIQKEITRILETYFHLVMEDKKLINKDIENIRENYLRSIDEERDDIVQNVEKMSEDQKQIYLNHKKYKMGTQSIGKNTGLRIYNPEFEAEELARIERINNRKKERGLSAVPDDPEALAREYAVEDEGDAPDMDADDVMNETQEDDGQEEYAASADMYPDSYQDEGVEEVREEE